MCHNQFSVVIRGQPLSNSEVYWHNVEKSVLVKGESFVNGRTSVVDDHVCHPTISAVVNDFNQVTVIQEDRGFVSLLLQARHLLLD